MPHLVESAAVHNAYRAVADLQQEKMGPLAAGIGQPGMPEIPGLSGFFSGAADEPGPGEPGPGEAAPGEAGPGELGPGKPGWEPGPPAP